MKTHIELIKLDSNIPLFGNDHQKIDCELADILTLLKAVAKQAFNAAREQIIVPSVDPFAADVYKFKTVKDYLKTVKK